MALFKYLKQETATLPDNEIKLANEQMKDNPAYTANLPRQDTNNKGQVLIAERKWHNNLKYMVTGCSCLCTGCVLGVDTCSLLQVNETSSDTVWTYKIPPSGATCPYQSCNKGFWKEFMESQFVLGGPLEELSFCPGGFKRKVMVTADTRGHGECDGGASGLK